MTVSTTANGISAIWNQKKNGKPNSVGSSGRRAAPQRQDDRRGQQDA